jgi:hypothetical protein
MKSVRAGYTFLLIGLAFAILGYLSGIVSETWLEWRLNHGGAATQGQILSRQIQRTETAKSYSVTYEFLPQGAAQTITVEKTVNPDAYAIMPEGSLVTVWYVVNEPTASTVDRPESLLGLWIWLFVTGGSLILAAVLLRNTSPTGLLIGSGILLIMNGLVGVFMVATGNATPLQQSFNFVSVLGMAVGSLQMGIFITLGVGICLFAAGLFLGDRQ